MCSEEMGKATKEIIKKDIEDSIMKSMREVNQIREGKAERQDISGMFNRIRKELE